MIRNIPPNTDVERIYIVATNQVGLSSPKGVLKEKVCRTLETSRHGQLMRELNAAAAITGPFFDSDFYTVCTTTLIKKLTYNKLCAYSFVAIMPL